MGRSPQRPTISRTRGCSSPAGTGTVMACTVARNNNMGVSTMSAPQLSLEYCGEWFQPNPAQNFDIGREGDLTIDDNPYLHRRFLKVSYQEGIWWLSNVGSLLSATVCDTSGGVQSGCRQGTGFPLFSLPPLLSLPLAPQRMSFWRILRGSSTKPSRFLLRNLATKPLE